MKILFCLVAAACGLQTMQAQNLGVYQNGTVVRMKMGDCLSSRHGFMANFGSQQVPMPEDACPEYTLLSDKIVYVIVGSSSNQFVPLADIIEFRLHKGEIAIRLDDVKHESKFTIKEMILRSEWEQVRKHVIERLDASPRNAEMVPSRSQN
ncbi:MAG: hypothetical protein WA252_12970 [Candidatus Sulfotelmatobacter sp.]